MSEKKTTLSSLRKQNGKTVKAENEKKLIINKYLKEQHPRTKGTNLCWREISLW